MNFAKINGADIFATGTWNGLSFNEDDIDGMVKAFDVLDLAGKVPLKLGHEGPDVRDDPTTQFAMGWVTRIWRDGRKLMADLDVPDQVNKLIKEGYLKFVSVELLKNVKASTREIPWVLDAVALLGSDSPAVGVLKDLQALTMTRRAASLPHSECVTFARDRSTNGEITKMADESKEDVLQKLLAAEAEKTALAAELARAKGQMTAMSRMSKELEDMKAANAERERAARRAELAAVFERAIEDEEIVPAARERFMRTYRVNDDEYVMAVTAEDAKQFVKENPSPLPRRKAKPTQFSLDRVDGEVPSGTRPDDEATMRAKALLASRNIHAPTWEQLAAAAKEVFTSNPTLGDRYKYHPDHLARQAIN